MTNDVQKIIEDLKTPHFGFTRDEYNDLLQRTSNMLLKYELLDQKEINALLCLSSALTLSLSGSR